MGTTASHEHLMNKSPHSSVVRTSLLALVVFCTGCAGLSPREKDQAHQLRMAGISETACGTKNGWISGPLNIIPGIGNFYLATGEDRGSQITYGILNIIPGWLLWPITCLWSVPQAAIDADNISQRQTVIFYFDTEEGRKEFERLKALNAGKTSTTPAP